MSLSVKIKQFQVAKSRGDKIAKIEFRGVSHFSRVIEGTGELIFIDEDKINNIINMQDPQENNLLFNVPAEYENVIRSIEVQLELTKEEHNSLKQELYQLISENQKLTDELDLEYRDKLQEAEDGNFVEIFKSEIVLNLQNQLDLCKKEKERTLELYKTSLKLIEQLEGELSSQQEVLVNKSQVQTSVPPPAVSVLEAKLKNAKEHLEIALSCREQLESEIIRNQTEIAKLKLKIESNDKIIEQLKTRVEDWKAKCLKCEQESTLLNATYECVVRSRDELEKKLDIYSSKIQELVQKNSESRSKVEEALDIIEKALAEKESASLREVQLKEEVNKLQLCLEHVIDEAGKKVGTAVEETKKKFESEMKEVLAELSDVKKELEKKKTEHKRLSFKYKKLEKLASTKLDKEKISLIKGSETEIIILENHLDSVYQELERFKRKHEELGIEKKKLENEFSELIEKHQTLMKDKDLKEASFAEIVRKLQIQIEQKIDDLNEASRRTEFFLNQVRDLQAENKKLATLAGNCSCTRLKAKIKKLNEFQISQRTELEAQIESQMKLNESWKTEIKEITVKYEEKMNDLKRKCNQWKAKNKRLELELSAAKKKIFLMENA